MTPIVEPWWEICPPEKFRTLIRIPDLREDFIAWHMPLVSRVTGEMTGVDLSGEDLLQMGAVGLLRAIDLWEPGYGVPFEEMAAAEIEDYIRMYWDSTLPRWRARREEKRADDLETALDRLDPRIREVLVRRYGLRGHTSRTVGEVAEELGLTPGEVSRLQRRGEGLLARFW